jgi:excisionase family DNA binding protein
MDKLLTTREVAAMLSCHPMSVYRNKELPSVKIPGVGKRFRKEDLNEYLEKRSHKPPLISSNILSNQSFRLISDPKNGMLGVKKSGGKSEMAKAKTKTRLNFGYGAIYQRKTKTGKVRWYLDFKDARGRRVQRLAPSAISKEEAVQALIETVRREFDREYRIKREKEPITFSQLAEMYLENYAKLNKRSWMDDEYRINANMKPFFGPKYLNEVTPLSIEKYRAKRLKDGVSRSTVNRETTIMKRMFNLAIDWRLTESNPYLKVRLFSEKGTEKERILSREEEERLLEKCPVHLSPVIVSALNTGMRRGEILNLKWKQIDFKKREIRVENTKSGDARILPVNAFLFSLLESMKSQNGASEFVFPNPRTGQPYTELKKSFKAACRDAGIKDLRFHDLRHTFATRLVHAGVDLITVRDLLGHFSIRVTQRYTHSNRDQKRKAVEVLSDSEAKKAKKTGIPLHIRDTEETSNPASPANSLTTVN